MKKAVTNNNSEAARPLVSVYVTTYNHERYIADCLEGILMQECDFPIEVIVIDDASQDSNPQIIKDYAARFPQIIKPVLHTENQMSQGRSHVFDTFLPRAQGEFMAICDGDDFWTDKHKLQRQVDFLKLHPDYSACFHLHELRYTGDDKVIRRCAFARERACNVTDILFDMKAQMSTLLVRLDNYRRDNYIQECRKNFEYKRFTDILFMAYEMSAGKVWVFTKFWSVYRIHNQSVFVSYRETEDWHKIKSRCLKQIEEFWPDNFSGITKQYESHHILHTHLVKFHEKCSEKRYLSAVMHLIIPLVRSPRQFFRVFANSYL